MFCTAFPFLSLPTSSLHISSSLSSTQRGKWYL
jgi:hypothetical protein